jgi:AcrR family transcriptional regulator
MRKSSQMAAARGYHHGNLRRALIETGLKLIQQKGVRALTLREIGNRIGVSRMAPYRHFADKAALLAAIREEGFTVFADDLARAKAEAKPDFASRLTAMALAYVRFSARHAAYFEVMFGPQTDAAESDPHKDAGRKAFDLLAETIREGQVSGDVRSGDSEQLALVAWSLVHGISALRLQTSDDEGELTKFACEALRSGLQARTAPRGRRRSA